MAKSENSLAALSKKGAMDMIQIIGLVAGACTSLAAVPQLVKTWKTKEVDNISMKMFLLYVVGMSLWLTYGIVRSDVPIIVTNAIALTFHGMMLFLKLKYKNKGGTATAPA